MCAINVSRQVLLAGRLSSGILFLCLCMIFPITSARTKEASLPLGSNNPYSSCRIVSVSPACNSAEVPTISTALSETRVEWESMSTLYLRATRMVRQAVIIFVREAISILSFARLQATVSKVEARRTTKFRADISLWSWSRGKTCCSNLALSRNCLVSKTYERYPLRYLTGETVLFFWMS